MNIDNLRFLGPCCAEGKNDNTSPENYSVLCARLFTLKLSTPLKSGDCVLSAYEITFLDMVTLQRKEQNYFVLYAF